MRNSSSIYRRKGFTLIELLVVIAIIGTLAGLMYPAVTGALVKAERAHAENTAYNLKNSIAAYFTEYRKYPVPPNTTEEQLLVTGTKGDVKGRSSNFPIMDVLLGADSQAESGGLNPRRIAFYTDKEAKRGVDDTYRKGIRLSSDGGGELWDPYANYYFVRLDLDYNNRTVRPEWDRSGDKSDYVPESILVWSAGKDNDEDAERDNVKTW